MSHLSPGLISAYNSLTDKHLTGYFNNTRIRRHLQRVGLITRSGRIVPDKEYRHKLLQRAHQRHVRECLAQAIFHKVLEMERLHQIEIKRKLEEFARRERVHRIKVERSKRYEEDIIRILSPRPPTGPRGVRAQHSGPEGEHSESSESPGSSRPNTAPGKMQRPVRLKPIHSNSTTASHRRSSPYRHHESSNEAELPFNCTMDKESRRRLTMTEFSRGVSPYCLPVINNFVTPVPPTTKRKERGVKVTTSGTLRGRRLRPTTAPGGPDVNEESPLLRSAVPQSRVCVNMVYFGKAVHLSHDLADMRDEVKVFQQHCGGENLCVYKGKLREGESFQFVSRRHRGFPFSLTFFLNGLQVERLSSCCEFKHRKGSRLGGRHGHFGVSGVEAASPCYKCIIAMGLDKKPTPPPKRVKEDEVKELTTASLIEPPKDVVEMEREGAEKDSASCQESESSHAQDMETEVKEDLPPEEDKVRDDYEEDFEADDEGPVEDETKEQKSVSPSSDKERQDKEKDASESEDDDKDEDRKSHSASSVSGSDREESDVEDSKDVKEEQTAERSEDHEEDAQEVDQEETPAPPAETDKSNTEDDKDDKASESVSPIPPHAATAAKDLEMQDSPGDSTGCTELEVSDATVPSGNEGKGNDDVPGDEPGKEDEKRVDECKQEEEPERAKSVQEKLAEAILKETQCSSEPELSDTSTEEEEESTQTGSQQNNKDAVPEKSVTFTEQQQTHTEEMKHEEIAVDAAEVVEDHGEVTSELKDKEDETEPEPHENGDSARDDTGNKDMDVEKAASEIDKGENTEHKDALEESEQTDASPCPESAEKMAEDRSSEPQEDEPAKCTDAEAAEKEQEKEQEEENVPAEADTQPDEKEQGAKSNEEDESSASELNKITDETTAPDNTEVAAVTASEMVEMKAEALEEQNALSCEEAPVTDSERQGQEESTAGGTEAEVAAENSSKIQSMDESETTVHAGNTADTSETKAEDEPSTADIKEEAAEEASGAEVCMDEDGKQESDKDNQINGQEEEEIEKADEVNTEEDKEEKMICDNNTEDKQENLDEIIAADNTEEREDTGQDKTEEEGADESKAEESMMEDEENAAMRNEDDVNAANSQEEAKAEPLEERCDNEDEAKDEEKGDEAEKTEKGEDDSKVESSSCVNDDIEESEEKTAKTEKSVEAEEISEVTEEREKIAEENADKDEETVKNIVESEDVGECEAVEEAHVTETEDKAEEITDNVVESGDVQKESEKENNNSEKGEVDSENGETATGAENKTQADDAESPTQDINETKTEDCAEDETKTTELTQDQTKTEDCAEEETKSTELTQDQTKTEQAEEEGTEAQKTVEPSNIETGESSEGHEEKREDDTTDQAPDVHLESTSKTEDDGVENQEEPSQGDLEPVTSGMEFKEESKLDDVNADIKDTEAEEMKEHAGINTEPTDQDTAIENEDRGSDMSAKNVHNSFKEVILVSSGYQAQISEPVAVESDSTAHKIDEEKVESNASCDSKVDKSSKTDENAAGDHQSAVDGENGADTEEASKPSEEGASVLLKPQATETEKNGVTPEALESEDNTDLVTNWVNIHQASKFFEKFVEPLDDLKGLTLDNTAKVSNNNTTATESTNGTELSRSESPVKMLGMSEQGAADGADAEASEKEPTPNYENESGDNTKVEAIQSDLRSNHSKEDEPCESEPTKDTLQMKEETEDTALIPITEAEQNGEESATHLVKEDASLEEQRAGTSGSHEDDKVQDAATQRSTDQTDICKTEMESIAGSHHSAAIVRPESVTENPKEEKATEDDPGLNDKQTAVEEIKDLLSSSITEEHQEGSERSSKLVSADMTAAEPEGTKEPLEEGEKETTDITEVTDLTTSKSDDGSQEESPSGEIKPSLSEQSLPGDKKDIQLIEDIKHTLSKDRLSTFSMEETLFGHSSYPLLTTARTENGH
ncbi:glutamate-rich protein 3 [Myripristis murdjan]|uniref:glutamate-rich protein 3 n=1 Tax=Myripristis murdjan TaxID=586833 RepID=UPI0011762938|nr:glutamate-rich protein 3 [Myripristis murdjan]